MRGAHAPSRAEVPRRARRVPSRAAAGHSDLPGAGQSDRPEAGHFDRPEAGLNRVGWP